MNFVAKQKNRMYVIGVPSLLLSAVLTAFSQVFYANRVQTLHPFLFTGVSFFITTLFFQLVASKQKVTVQWKFARAPLVKLNIASVLAFMGFYFALKYIEPAIVSSLEMGLGPLFALLLAAGQKGDVDKRQWAVALGTFGACLLLIVSVFTGSSALESWDRNSVIGIIASIFCGFGAVLCTTYSKQLSEVGWTSSMILAKRFYGIILLSLLATYDMLFAYLTQHITWIAAMTAIGVLLPMYLLQKGIQYCEVFIVMMSLCFIPVFTFIFQLFDSRLHWSNSTFIGVILLLLLGVASVYIKRREKDEMKEQGL